MVVQSPTNGANWPYVEPWMCFDRRSGTEFEGGGPDRSGGEVLGERSAIGWEWPQIDRHLLLNPLRFGGALIEWGRTRLGLRRRDLASNFSF